jgi:alkylation response protein AidB-like acyl-CoA dehydrogenase
MTTSLGSFANRSTGTAGQPGREAGETGGPSLSNELFLGVLRWDLLVPFPVQDDEDRRAGDERVAEFTRYLRTHVDPNAVDAARELPADVVEALRDGGYLRLLVGEEDGGVGLSPFNAFRLIETASSWSLAVANMMGIGNGFGAGGYLRMLPDGALREVIRAHVAAGNFSGRADTEPAGAGNAEPAGAADPRQGTTATPVDGGTAYLLNGEKVFIGNAAIADLLDVTATVVADGAVDSDVSFFVDARTPGLEVVERQDFMGLGGAPIATLRLRDVRVPSSRMFRDRRTRDMKEHIYLARTLSVVPPSLAIARLCAHWSREFVNRRRIDGRPLGSFQEIQRIVASTVADTFAMESLVHWTMLGRGTDVLHEHVALKNVASESCWRVIDRTMGLLGGEGFETAHSKARRGAQPLPVERFFRDVRGLRISGGVDFLIDYLGGRIRLTDCYYDRNYTADSGVDGETAAARRLVARHGAEHVEFVTEQAARLGRTCRDLTERHPDRKDLFDRQHTVLTLNRIANELLTTAAALARSASASDDDAASIAAIHCATARRRVAALWAELDDGDEHEYAEISARWLGGPRYDALLGDAITAVPGTGDR